MTTKQEVILTKFISKLEELIDDKIQVKFFNDKNGKEQCIMKHYNKIIMMPHLCTIKLANGNTTKGISSYTINSFLSDVEKAKKGIHPYLNGMNKYLGKQRFDEYDKIVIKYLLKAYNEC